MAAATTLAKFYGQLAGEAAMRIVDACVCGEQWAVELYEKWKATGEAPALVVDDVQKVGEA
jgi:hypothetical protein